MLLKKIGKALLFPRIAVMIMLIPIAIVFLVYSMVRLVLFPCGLLYFT